MDADVETMAGSARLGSKSEKLQCDLDHRQVAVDRFRLAR